jgi:hypothetical protein
VKAEQKTGVELARETIAELREKYALNPETRYLMALIMADEALRAQMEPKPLTLEQLRERNGKSVVEYGETWVAYDREPRGGRV